VEEGEEVRGVRGEMWIRIRGKKQLWAGPNKKKGERQKKGNTAPQNKQQPEISKVIFTSCSLPTKIQNC